MTSDASSPLPLRPAKTWTAKVCDVCGEGTSLRAQPRRRYELSTRKHRVEMLLDDVICERCGFLFAGRVPDVEFISDFYRDAHTPNSAIRDIKPDFDAEARLTTLRKHLKQGCTVLEIGANDGAFTKVLREYGFNAVGLDPLETARKEFVVSAFAADGSETGTLQPARKKYDAVTAYYVLEHVSDARAWLAEARDYLAPGDILIIEVPDFESHPVESLYPEHFLHLTPAHLSRLLQVCGFEILECGEARPSRYFGFTAVARRVETVMPPSPLAAEQSAQAVERTEQRRADALALIAAEEQRMSKLAEHVISKLATSTTPPAVFAWAANIHATRIARALKALRPDLVVTAVDSAVSKMGTLHDGFASPVIKPEFSAAHSESYLFLLCSPNWNADIRDQILSLGLPNVETINVISWKPV
jgi:2-polyprenyl-3-methyl-5-hydroxy-6-metoxy-1,4-benzoquinol methylase